MSANGAPSNTNPPPPQNNLSDSTATFPSDSENYSASEPSAVNGTSPSPPSTSSSPLILYSPPTIWSLLRGAAINLILPFVNGLMLGFGELLAHEAAFRFGWSGTKVCQGSCLGVDWSKDRGWNSANPSRRYSQRTDHGRWDQVLRYEKIDQKRGEEETMIFWTLRPWSKREGANVCRHFYSEQKESRVSRKGISSVWFIKYGRKYACLPVHKA